MENWHDADAEGSEYRLAEFARRIHDLDKLRVHYDGQRLATDAEFDALVPQNSSKPAAERSGGYRSLIVISLAA